jgi:hypothetical protein
MNAELDRLPAFRRPGASHNDAAFLRNAKSGEYYVRASSQTGKYVLVVNGLNGAALHLIEPLSDNKAWIAETTNCGKVYYSSLALLLKNLGALKGVVASAATENGEKEPTHDIIPEFNYGFMPQAIVDPRPPLHVPRREQHFARLPVIPEDADNPMHRVPSSSTSTSTQPNKNTRAATIRPLPSQADIETHHPCLGLHSTATALATTTPPSLSIARAYTSHETLSDAPLSNELIEGRVSRYDEKSHVWAEMLQAAHPEHTIDTGTQTRASIAEVIAAREQWTANWLMCYAPAVNNGTLTSAFAFGKHVPHPDDENSPLNILNRYAC